MTCAKRIALVMLTALFGCSGDQRPGEVAVGPAPVFVAFRDASMMITRINEPVRPPYAVGSSPARARLTSSNPEVVDVDLSANLVAHRNGEATLRDIGGATLHITVNAPSTLTLVPARLELQPGEKRNVEVLADARALPPNLLHWRTTNPNVAAAFGTLVQAGMTAGAATLTIQYGSLERSLAVNVRASETSVTIEPRQVTLSIGAVQRFDVGRASTHAQWSTSNARVLEQLQPAVFLARALGSARVCAFEGPRQACAVVSVVR